MEGGAANACGHLALGLRARGHEVHVLTAALEGEARRTDPEGPRLIEVPVPGHRGGAFSVGRLAWFAWRSARGTMCPAGVDVVHAFFSLPGGWVARRWAHRAGVPYVVSLRGSDVPGFRSPRTAPVFRALAPVLRRVWQGAGAVVANSDELKNLAAESWTGPVEVIPNGVDADRFAPAEGGSDSGIRVLMVNQLIPRKRVSSLLDAWPHVLSRGEPSAALDIVGRGHAEADLRARVRSLGVEGSVFFHGALPRSDMPARYRASDLFVLLSEREGMSNALLEAMASGLACCVSPGANAGSLVQDGVSGLVVDPMRPDWWHVLADLLRRPEERRRLGAAARSRVESQFSWASVTERYIELYGRVRSGGSTIHV